MIIKTTLKKRTVLRAKFSYHLVTLNKKETAIFFKRCKSCNKKKTPIRCKHDRQKYQCKDCGTGYCEHKRPKYRCKKCGTGQCHHGKPKSRCKECGTGHCEHKRLKHQCKKCGTGQCHHGKSKYRCKECNPIGYLSCIVSTRIRNALKNGKSKKKYKILRMHHL